LVCAGLLFSTAVRAECGGLQECIAISSNSAVAPRHSADGVNRPAPTRDFGNQAAASASAARTILVAAVEGPTGTRATLSAITLSGPNASDFTLAGGTCTTGTPTLLHDGAVIAQIANACTILVTFNPTAIGVKNAQVNVSSAAIVRVAPLTGTGTASIAGPGAGAAAMNVTVNTPATLDLAPFTSGVVAGIAIVTPPTHGTATVTGTRVTYTPVRDYFGPDAFTYAAFNADGSSPAAPVTVNIGGRPDPATDPSVVGLLSAQTQTAQRFARAQIANFQRRLEGLHLGSQGVAGVATGRWSPGNAHQEARGIRLAMAPGAADALVPPQLLGSVLTAAATGTIDLASVNNSAGGAGGYPDESGIWISGNIGFGTRDETATVRGMRFRTDGVSIGADRRFSDKLALGMGIGYARDTTTIGTDGSESHSEGVSLTMYGSFQPTRSTFIDGLVGYGALRHRSQRFVPAVSDLARMKRDGSQIFGSIAAGYEFHTDGVLLSPYGRLDLAYDRFKQASETGAGANALTYFKQTQKTVQAALGVRAESRHETSFGYVRPRLRVELKHDFEGEHDANIAFSDQVPGPVYTVSPPGRDRNALLLGVGSDFEFRSGLKFGVDYVTQGSSGSDRDHAVRLWLRKEFDGKPLPSGLPTAKLFADPVRVEGGYMWDDNVTRAPDSTSLRLSDHIYNIAVTKTAVSPLTEHTRLLFSGFVNGEKFYTYTGLDRASVGVRAETQYRTSGVFGAPTLGLFAQAVYDEYSSNLRRGSRYAYGLNARQSWTDRIDAFAAYTRSERDANHAVFDAQDWSALANIDFSLGQAGIIYLGGEYRRGDTVTTSGPPGAGYGGYAKALVQDDAYADNMQLFAYRLKAKTVIWTLGYNRPLGARDSIDFSWRRAQSTSLQPPVAAGITLGGGIGTPRYTTNQYSIVYLMRF
jgi:outer membrane autotransporter protein